MLWTPTIVLYYKEVVVYFDTSLCERVLNQLMFSLLLTNNIVRKKVGLMYMWTTYLYKSCNIRKLYLLTCVSSEDSDQPSHTHSLIRIFTRCILDSQGCQVSSCRQWRLCRCADKDLSLCWAHMLEGTFSHVAAHILCRLTRFYNSD